MEAINDSENQTSVKGNMNNIKEKKIQLLKLKENYFNLIKEIDIQIKEKDLELSRECIRVNKEHVWVSEREGGIYGEKYTFCKECRIDYYRNSFH